MRVLELFAGAGGAALGLERAGLEHAALVERDPDACATLRAAGLGPVVEGDVRDLDAIEAVAGPSVDMLWASWPCQPFSQAGARKGAADDRNGWPWTVAAIDRFRPAWFLGENVRGHTMHSKDGHPDPMRCPACYLERQVLADLRQRFAHVGYWVLDCADYGVPQHRRRLIVWAGPERLLPPSRTHGSGMFTRPWVTMGEALGIRPGDRCIGAGRNPQHAGAPRTFRDLTDEPSTTVTAVQVGNAGPWVVAAGETGQGRPRPMSRPAPTIGTKGTAYLLRPAPTVTTTEVKGTCGKHMKGGPDRASDALWLATGRRRLTVPECAALQAFPAAYPWHGTKTSRYRQVGNAVPPRLAQVVAKQVPQ